MRDRQDLVGAGVLVGTQDVVTRQVNAKGFVCGIEGVRLQVARDLVNLLQAAGEPVKPADAVRAAGEAGFSRATLYRARSLLGALVIEQGKSGRDPNKRWALVDPAYDG